MIECLSQDSMKSVTQVRTLSVAQEHFLIGLPSLKCYADSLSVCPTLCVYTRIKMIMYTR